MKARKGIGHFHVGLSPLIGVGPGADNRLLGERPDNRYFGQSW
jgi:hypothetical protein